MFGDIIKRDFYTRNSIEVAKDLLGKCIVRKVGANVICGKIVETEVYRGFDDTASHAHKGPTERCKVMFGEAGHAYIYLTYGIHNMLNLVTEDKYFPSAVLIRALEPVLGVNEGVDEKGRKVVVTNGPGKLAKTLKIDRSLNGIDLTIGKDLWVSEHKDYSNNFDIKSSERVGIDYAHEKDRKRLWRFFIKENSYVSR